MIKPYAIFLQLVLLSLLCGCIHPVNTTPISHNKDYVVSKKTTSVSSESEKKITPTGQQPSQPESEKIDTLQSANNQENISDIVDSKKCDIAAQNLSSLTKMQTVLDEALGFCQASQDFWQKGELESAFEALDQAYALILNVNTYNNSRLMQQKEDLRFMISKRILEIYASRNIVINGGHNAIPLVMNKHIQKELRRFTKGNEKKFFIESYKRSGMFRDKIIKSLEEAGLPSELSWLPLIESGFKVTALSKARALGLWQFIPSTGYKFGLKRNLYIDERLDPIKSTKAAIAYLKELHQIFGDWATVLAAYNCGEGRVLRVIRTQNVNYLDNFWDLYGRLPRETARYVPRFLATLHIINNPKKYGLDTISFDPFIEYETVTVSKQVLLKDIAKEIGVTKKILKHLNPELRYDILPNDKYALRIPLNKGDLLISKLDKIPVSSLSRQTYVKHRVRPGETLSTIAERYHSNTRKIAQANNISKHNFIVAGKTIKIPQKGVLISKPTKQAPPKSRQTKIHIVKSGDSLWIIAKHYGTTTKKIQELNKLRTTNLHIKQILKIPGQGGGKAHGSAFKAYKVKPGDSPFKIAKQYNTPLENFLRINHLTPRSKIYPGQELFVE